MSRLGNEGSTCCILCQPRSLRLATISFEPFLKVSCVEFNKVVVEVVHKYIERSYPSTRSRGVLISNPSSRGSAAYLCRS